MKNRDSDRAGRAGAAVCGFLLCLAAAVALGASSSPYGEALLNGNLQHQCTAFSATLVENTSFTVSAECNKAGDQEDTVVTGNATSFDLSGDVRIQMLSDGYLSWDSSLTPTNRDIAEECAPNGGSPFTASTTDVTLALTCTVMRGENTSGTREVNVSLPLNGNLQATRGGEIERR